LCKLYIYFPRKVWYHNGEPQSPHKDRGRKARAMTERPSTKSKRDAIRRISRDMGISESSIYKILANPLSFSKSTADAVRREAEKYGLHPSEGTAELPDTPLAGRTLRIGVLIPSRPLYFRREADRLLRGAGRGLPVYIQRSDPHRLRRP
jgi:hypothetical protein